MEQVRGCLEPVRDFAIVMVVVILALFAAGYVHEYAAQGGPAAIFGSLVPGVVLTLLYFRGRRPGWLKGLMGIVGGMFLAFSFGLAVFHGWEVQAEVVVGIGMVLVLVGIAILLVRAMGHFHKAMEMINVATQDPAHGHGTALFRDDGERIVVYPNRRRLLLQGLFQALLLAGLGSILAFAPPLDTPLVWWAMWLLTYLLLTVFLAGLYRLLIRTPTLFVGPEGILDNGSLLATGRGLLRWEEIHTVIPLATTSAGIVNTRSLLIVAPNGRAIRQRQPLWKRVLMLLLDQVSPFQLTIWQGLLDVPADELASQIARYVQTHAPPGWIELDDDIEADRSAQP